MQAPYNSQSYNRYSYTFNNPLSYTDPSGHQSCGQGGCGQYDDREPEESPPAIGQCPSGATCMSGDVAWQYGQDWQNQQSRQNPYSQLPSQILGAPLYAQGQHLLDQDAKMLQAEIVIGATTFVISGEALVVSKLVDLVKNTKNLQQLTKSLSKLEKGPANTHVYLGIKNGKAVYVGITKDIDTRQASHGDRFILQKITEVPLTRNQARAVEQNLIEKYPHFENKINSISPARSWYAEAKEWGAKWLEQNGY